MIMRRSHYMELPIEHWQHDHEISIQQHIWRHNLISIIPRNWISQPYLYCVVNIYCQGLSYRNNPNHGRNPFSGHGTTDTILGKIKNFQTLTKSKENFKSYTRYYDYLIWSSHINFPYGYTINNWGYTHIPI